MKAISEFGKFFKLFSEYAACLDGRQADTADELLLENVRFGMVTATKLAENLESVESLLKSAREKANQLERLRP